MGDFEERIKQAEVSKGPAETGEASSAPEEMNLELEKEKSSSLKKIVLFSGVVFVFLIFITILITSGVFGGNKISETQLIVGASFTMQENKSVKLEIQEEEHEIIVENVGEDWAEIVVRSDPLKFILKVNDVIEIDVDNDGKSDLRIKLFKIQDGEAVIAVKRIDKESCVEDWACEDWGGCSNGKRIRECFDTNECGSEFFRPFYEQKCLGNNPVEINETEQVIKGMQDVIRTKEIEFSDEVEIKSNMQDNESNEDVNDTSLINEEDEEGDEENNTSAKNITIEIINDSNEGGGPTQYGECGDGNCDSGENTSSYPYYCPEDCNPNNLSDINLVPVD